MPTASYWTPSVNSSAAGSAYGAATAMAIAGGCPSHHNRNGFGSGDRFRDSVDRGVDVRTLLRRLPLGVAAVLLVATVFSAGVRAQGAAGQAVLSPPIPTRRPHTLYYGKVPGENRGPEGDLMDPPLTAVDDLHWLRDESLSDPDVLAHLEAENAYTNASTWAQRHLRETLASEFRNASADDEELRKKIGGFVHYERREEGKRFSLRCRKPIRGLYPNGTSIEGNAAADWRFQWEDTELGEEEVYLDENEVAANASYFRIYVAVSHDHAFVVYMVDRTGAESYEMRVRHIASGIEREGDTVKGIRSYVRWGLDNRTLFFVTITTAFRSHKVVRRTLAPFNERTTNDTAAAAVDEVLYTESNIEYHAGFWLSRSMRVLFFGSSSWGGDNEFSMVDLVADAKARAAGRSPPAPVVVEPRRPGHHHDLEHLGGNTLLVRTNMGGATNGKLMTTTLDKPGSAHWVDVMPYDANVAIRGVTVCKRYVLLHLRMGGFTRLATVSIVDGSAGGRRLDVSTYNVLAWDETISHVSGYGDYDSRTFEASFQSMLTPRQTWAVDGLAGNRTMIRQRIVRGYNRSLYRSERWEAMASDGTIIPMSVVYRADRRPPAGTPGAVHLYGYGGFDISVNPWFSASRLSLLDRGVVWVNAHIRGGGAFGRIWSAAGQNEGKNNSITDFITCGRHLAATGITTASNLTISGHSGGGTLVGATYNFAPDMVAGILTMVPLLDPLSALADPTAPLSSTLWGEWGNPNTASGYEWIRGYSPMQNIVDGRAPPAMLIGGGRADVRVGYWEGAQFAARVRAAAPDAASARRVLYISNEKGHSGGGASHSFRLAWLLWQHGFRH